LFSHENPPLALATLFAASPPVKLNNQCESPSTSSVATDAPFLSSELVKFSNKVFQMELLPKTTTLSFF